MKRSKQRPEADEDETATPEALRHCALGLLGRREHSRLELRQKLAARGFPDDLIDEVLRALAGEGLQSDARFASSYVHSRATRGYGPVRIRSELRQRGVDEDLAEHQLQDEQWDWPALAEAARRKRFGGAVPAAWPERAKQARFLQYRGFGSEHIQQLLVSREYGE